MSRTEGALRSERVSRTRIASPGERGSHIEVAALIALTVLAAALRTTQLSRSLFTDETYSLALAQRSFGHMFGLFGYEANGTPYPIVLWPLIRVFGTGEVVLRAPAALAGAASIPALWWAARRLGSSAASALVAAALLAIEPMATWYSQEARPYAFVVLAACLAFGALPRAVAARDGGARARAGYVAAMVALAYCDLLAVPIALPAQALIARRAGRKGVRRWLGTLVAIAVLCLPLLVAAAIARSRRDALYWLPHLSRALVEGALQEFTAGLSDMTGVRWATLAAAAALTAAALWRLRRSAAETQAAASRSRLAVAACWAVAPPAILLAISALEPVFWPRYAILALPGGCLLVAEAAMVLWSERQGRVLAAVCVAAVAAGAVAADARQRSVLQEDWPPIATWLRSERASTEPVIVDNALVLPSLGYYDPQLRASDGKVVVQEWKDRTLPAGFVGFKDRGSYGTVALGPPSAGTFTRLALSDGGNAWMVISEVDEGTQGNPREGEAAIWARHHCRVQVRESVGVWALHATGCTSPTAAGGTGSESRPKNASTTRPKNQGI